MKIVPSNQWTMEKRGTKCDKQQLTAVFACTMSGNLQRMLLTLPIAGLMKVSYLENVIVPYVKQERKALELKGDHCALALFDVSNLTNP